MEDEVMFIVDNLPFPDKIDKELEKQNQIIEKLKKKLKMLISDGGPEEHLHGVQQQLTIEFEKLDELLKAKLEFHSKSMKPMSNIIHLPTTEGEDNLPPIILYDPSHSPDSIFQQSLQIPSHNHPGLVQQRKAEEKLQKIQQKLLDLCCNDISSRSAKQSTSRDTQNNLDEDIKRQFDHLYSELRVLEKELFHKKNHDFDSSENTDRNDELEALKKENFILLEQCEHFRVLVEEQRLEIENYREKYMETLQNVMEQHERITSMKDMSKYSEKRTCEEINRMKNNLRKKLEYLAPMSNMLEASNKKLIYTIETKKQLEQNYRDICEELRQVKKELANSMGGSYKVKCDALDAELKRTKEINENNMKRMHQMQQQLKRTNSELENVKFESYKIIKSTNERCEFVRKELKSRINKLEIELAKSRVRIGNSK